MSRTEVGLLLRTLQLRGREKISPGEWTPSVLKSILPVVQSEGAERWLLRRLEALGISSQEGLAEILRPMAREQAIRWMRVDEQAEAVIREFTAHGVSFVLIKGVARRAATGQLYPYGDAKSSSDVDVLVPEAEAETAWQVLIQQGYQPAANPTGPRTHPLHFHLPPLWDDRRVAVEIHFSTDRWVPPHEAWRRATERADPVTWSGHELRVPNATELIWQGLAHAFKQGPTQAYRLRSLLDAAAILASPARIQWDIIRERIAAGEAREQRWMELSPAIPSAVVHRWLGAAAVLAGAELPEDLRTQGAVSLERVVRWRALLAGIPSPRIHARLLDEGIRCEAGMAPSSTPSISEVDGYRRARPGAARRAARMSYLAWRGLWSGL